MAAPTALPRLDVNEARERINQLLVDDVALNMVFQSIVELDTRAVVGSEALARFSLEPQRGPQAWFMEAGRVGLLQELEVAAMSKALRSYSSLPDGTRLFINASPSTLAKTDLTTVIPAAIAHKVALELSADATVSYRLLSRALEPLREQGMWIAIDDAGRGTVSLTHLARMHPEVIKIDATLTRELHTDVTMRAIAAGLVAFADELGSMAVAEAIETEEELKSLQSLGVRYGQGYLFGHPAPLT